ncbi:MAG: hypothetical protein ACK4ND_02705 [Cytophagaceae bacterium]
MKVKCFLVLLAMFAMFSSCKKKEELAGEIKVAVRYTPTGGGYFLYQGLRVELFKGDEVVATQFLYSGNGTIDFGRYEYGTYSVKLVGNEFRGSEYHQSIVEQRAFELNRLTVTQSFDIYGASGN